MKSTANQKYPRLETRKLTELAPNLKNPRRASAEGIGRLTKSLAELGNLSPITFNVRTGKILGGHQRVKCLAAMGRTETEAWCVDLPEDKEAAAMLAMNNHAGEWDASGLQSLLAEIDAAGIDRDLTGFDADGIEKILAQIEQIPNDVDAEPQIDRAAELRAEWKTERGQVLELGEHRLMCGDSTSEKDVRALMCNELADIVWTDPPYGVDYVGKTKNALTIENDGASDLSALLEGAFTQADAVMIPGGVYYIAHPDVMAFEFIHAVRTRGWVQARPPVVLWVKDSFVMGRGDYHSRSEPILYGWKPGAGHFPVKDRTQDNVWEIPRPKASEEHPTMKPVELVVRALKNSSKAQAIAYEPFSGSGTTIIACEQLGRKCRAMEISPAYVAVALQRFKDATGKEPKLITQ